MSFAQLKYIKIFLFSVGIFLVIWLSDARSGSFPAGSFSSYPIADTSDSDTGKLKYPIEDNTDDFISKEKDNAFDLKDPSNIEKSIEYDPVTKQYVIKQSIGNFYYRNPTYQDFDEFLENEFRKNERDYWKKRANASSLLGSQGILPKLHVSSKVVDRLFGGTTIEIKPTGSIDLTFGANYQKVDNPILTEQQRKSGGFNFDMNIQANVVGNIGKKLKLNFNYNTKATFDFENQIKLEYTGDEDQIIKKIMAGNVNLPLSSSLITGSQDLFGIKTQLQFGRLTVTNVISQQKGKTESIQIQGGARTNPFEIEADDYEDNKHFFVAQYFRRNYNDALTNLPVINSLFTITKMEVWVTNKTGATIDTRDIVAFMDLAEDSTWESSLVVSGNIPGNGTNSLYNTLIADSGVRNTNTSVQNLTYIYGLDAVEDFEKTYARKLTASEYTFHPLLGYISLNQTLQPDEVLAVAFEYTYNGKLYKVGEFAQDVPPGSNNSSVLFLKLLKSTSVRPTLPIWKLMMKNIYSLNAYQVKSSDFSLDIYYRDPGGGEIRYIPRGSIKGIPLISVLGLDNLNNQLDPTPDGIFDFISGITIEPSRGRIIFPVLEPFGKDLRKQFNNKNIADKYVYDILYDSTQVIAQQFPEFNRYLIKGTYTSSVSSDISLNTFNLPEGSVKVTAGGRILQEGTDYTVDYNIGRVKIINTAILNSGVPINVSFESSDLFGFQQKTLFGSRFDYWISDNFTLGGTLLHLSERPLTQKVNFGNEPISNTIYGIDGNYHTESQFLTKLVDKIPLIDTKEPSSITVTGEFAHFIPGHPKAIGKEGITYLDDFEGTRSFYDLKLPVTRWQLASTPQKAEDEYKNILFPEADSINSLAYGYNRAKLSWYAVDPLFTRDNSSTPDHLTDDDKSNHYVREIKEEEVFTNKDLDLKNASVPVLNLAYYPNERGPYNFDVSPTSYSAGINSNGKLNAPQTRWGGIMQDIPISDFEESNVEFIEFWLLDPFIYDSSHTSGEMYIQLGNISEDILKDGRKFFENGLPKTTSSTNIDTSIWGKVPVTQPVTNSFDNDPVVRELQDVGLDGIDDGMEKSSAFFKSYLDDIISVFGSGSDAYNNTKDDPSADNYHYYKGDDYDNEHKSITERYKNYNNPEGNSPTSEKSASLNSDGYPTSATNLPDAEDLNGDNTLSETEEYFQYRVKLTPAKLNVGQNFVTDKVTATVTLKNEKTEQVNWYQFKIPINAYQFKTNNIHDFKSIRFMRIFLTAFDTTVICRFIRFGLVRNQWRKYNQALLTPGEYIPSDNDQNTSFNVSVVNIEENSQRNPINYVMPPGIRRELLPGSLSGTNIFQNEQSLSMDVCNLKNGDARAAYKNLDLDMRNFKRIRMYIHAEEIQGQSTFNQGDLTAFIRLGLDFTANYYEYEIPLKPTPLGTSGNDTFAIWPRENELNLLLDSLLIVKQLRNQTQTDRTKPFTIINAKGNKITVVGSPDLSRVRTIMLGIRNPKDGGMDDDGLQKCSEVWFNELRLTEFDEEGGSAALARIDAKLADFGNIALSGNMHTIGFGSLDKSINDRFRDNFFQYDASSSFELGKFFPKKAGVSIPVYAQISESFSNPQYDPYESDILFKDKISATTTDEAKDSIKEAAQDYKAIKSINLTNIRKVSTYRKKKHLYDIDNFNLSYSYTEEFKRNPIIEYDRVQTYKGSLGYNYSKASKSYKPFNKLIKPKRKYLQLIKDFNFSLMPSNLSHRTELHRRYGERKLRSIGAELIPIDPTYDKFFTWNRFNGLKWNLTKSLSLDFSANANARIDEPAGAITQAVKDSIFTNIKKFGRVTKYNHNANITYEVPLNKIPLTNWIKLSLKYSTNYNWNAAPLAATNLGHTIANFQNKQVNASINTKTLYKGLRNTYNKIFEPPKSDKKKKEDEKAEEKKKGNKKQVRPSRSSSKPKTTLGKVTESMITSIRNLSFGFNEKRGTTLPGFVPYPKFLGLDSLASEASPGFGFALLGYQPDQNWLENVAVQKGWLTNDSTLNYQFLQSLSQDLNARAAIEPIKSFRIDLNIKRNYSASFSEYFRYVPDSSDFVHLNPLNRGSFSMSFITWRTMFDDPEALFKKFEEYRTIISQRLLSENPYSNGSAANLNGYGTTSQDVLIPAFLAAYSGKDASKINLKLPFSKLSKNPLSAMPLPNWRINYTGLNRLKWFKKIFSSFTIKHAYNSTYRISSFVSSLEYDNIEQKFPSIIDSLNDNFIPIYEINQISITEQLAPLIGINIQWKNNITSRIDFQKSRTLSMSFLNYQLNETSSNEIKIGIGYRMRGFSIPFKWGGIKRQLKNDLTFKLDFSYRKSTSIIRKLDQNISEPTSGNTTIKILPSIDYLIAKNLNIRIFFDWNKNIPETSASYPITNVNSGITLRYTLAP